VGLHYRHYFDRAFLEDRRKHFSCAIEWDGLEGVIHYRCFDELQRVNSHLNHINSSLVELIVLNVGLQAGILSQRVFTMFVVMALITTFLTTPIVTFLYVTI
jgi:hypothetical protein